MKKPWPLLAVLVLAGCTQDASGAGGGSADPCGANGGTTAENACVVTTTRLQHWGCPGADPSACSASGSCPGGEEVCTDAISDCISTIDALAYAYPQTLAENCAKVTAECNSILACR